MDEKRGKNGNRERSQKAVRPDITETRNSFEPLRRINEAQVDVSNEDNRSANNDDRSFRRPSCRPIDVTTQRTNQSVTNESTTQRDQTRPNRQKKVMIAVDSLLKHLQGHKMSRNSRVKISSFPGCTAEDMHDFIKPLLRKNPYEIILHMGTNSLRSYDTRRACAKTKKSLASHADVLNLGLSRVPTLWGGTCDKLKGRLRRSLRNPGLPGGTPFKVPVRRKLTSIFSAFFRTE